jgi:hypothetical protein
MPKGKRGQKASGAAHALPVTAMLKRVRDEQLRAIASGADVAERAVRQELGEAAAAYLRAMAPEARAPAARAALERAIKGASPEEATDWLAITVARQRSAMEQRAAEALAVEAQRRRGGEEAGRARQLAWEEWRTWIWGYANAAPAHLHENRRQAIIEVIIWRANQQGKPPSFNEKVPSSLPIMRGKGGGSLSEDSIRRALFGNRKTSSGKR